MTFRENVRVEWDSLNELEDAELLSFLNEGYKELRIGSDVARNFVTVDAVQKLVNLVDRKNECVKKVASDMVNCACNFLSDNDKALLAQRFEHSISNDSNALQLIKIDFATKISHEASKKILLATITNNDVGLKSVEGLKAKYQLTPDELEGIAKRVTDHAILLRIIDVASSGDLEAQKWGSRRLMKLVENTRDDPLLLVNVFELLYGLQVTVVQDSLSILKSLLHDPVIKMMPQSICSILKIFTKYYSHVEDEIPNWYIEQIMSESRPINFSLGSIIYLIGNRNSAEQIFRLRTKLRETVNENYWKDNCIIQVSNLLQTILSIGDNEELFNYWFPEASSQFYFALTLDPDVKKRECAVSLFAEIAKFGRSILYFRNIEDFPNFLVGPGCGDIRIKAAMRFASQPMFEATFGGDTTARWKTSNVRTTESYNPQVETLEM